MKIPIIRKGEYDIWSMRMRQYICHTDHNLWDVIVNGDLEEESAPTGETSAPPAPKTAKQLATKRNQEKVKSIFLLAIPDEYLLKFHNVADAKSLWEAIKSRFRVHGAPISKEDINQKFLRSLPPSWNQIALIMRNKSDIDEIDINDLYNNLRVYEYEMKRSGRNQGKRSYGDNGRSNAPTNESSSQALVAQDSLGGYDWSNDFEIEPVNYALMAISSSSSSSSSDNEQSKTIEAIRLFLAFASYMGFTVYQMDVKSAFLYGTIEEEVYVHQPPGFVDPAHPNKVYKVIKALYGLHQAPRAWYETLSSFLMENGFRRGTIDKTLFIKKNKSDIMLVQVYVDDIIFGSTKKSMCTEFEDCMHKRFQMSSMGELTFFLGLQVKQQPDGIFISQDKYVADILKKFDFWSIRTATTPIESNKPLVKDEDGEDVDVHVYRSMIGSLMYLTASRPDIMFAVCACARFQVTPKASHLNAVKRIFRYLKHQPKLGLWYPRDSPFELEAFSDSDYGGASLDRKSTTGGCQFLGRRLISWQCKKQTIVANSTTEAEYVAAANCCGQVLWIQNQMMDYGFNFMNTRIHIDNESTISVIKNPVAHSRTKHIKIRFYFIRDCYEKILIEVVKIHTDSNVADLLTKGFDVTRFNFLVVSIGMLNL
ncbi:putative ribonuclease H-like domain-containing protein [Tanacetum coccineum]